MRDVVQESRAAIEAERLLFEDDAARYDFDLTRCESSTPEPWSEYEDHDTGQRWGGWLAARGVG